MNSYVKSRVLHRLMKTRGNFSSAAYRFLELLSGMHISSFKTGDICEEKVEALVNTVNCVGVMGHGIALRFKEVFPKNFDDYAEACRHGKVRPDRMFVTQTEANRFPLFDHGRGPKYIINFPTKRHWRGNSRTEDIKAGLEALTEEIRERKIRSIAIPPLGCGLGGLPWGEVRHVVIFEPNDTEGVRNG